MNVHYTKYCVLRITKELKIFKVEKRNKFGRKY